ncbi:hypothetical protein ACH518_15360 [Methylomonas sp. HW2-6]|uniref:hypothetical protein n=1 Tax=Methylomonas sp. HW2-6 TaxID=3376687 RepID=UPI004041D6D8
MFDEDGKPLNPNGNIPLINTDSLANSPESWHADLGKYRNLSYEQFDAYTDIIIDNIFKQESRKKILIFIHGGLNTQMDSLARLAEDPRNGEICDDSKNDKVACKSRNKMILEDNKYYPIFVNWRSSLINSYSDGLFSIRQGKSAGIWGYVTAPFIFASDLTKSALRWPNVIGSLIYNDAQTAPALKDPQDYPATIAKETLCKKYQYPYRNKDNQLWDQEDCLSNLSFSEAPDLLRLKFKKTIGNNTRNKIIKKEENSKSFDIYIGEDERQAAELVTNFGRYIISFPGKILTTPIIDTFGGMSWDLMLRHIDMLFNSEEELTKSELTNTAASKQKLLDIPKHGGLSLFLKKLADKLREENDKEREIVLVGHSMGTIVANELIRNFGEDLPISKLVYVAGAATVHDYETKIFPWLSRDHNRHIYHFQLHPRAEESEKMAFDIPARGSLLVWIDNFLDKPLSPKQRTVGRYDNLLPSLHNTHYSLRDQISLKVYSAGSDVEHANPQTHSDMASRFKFWDDECWNPNSEKPDCVFPNQ